MVLDAVTRNIDEVAPKPLITADSIQLTFDELIYHMVKLSRCNITVCYHLRFLNSNTTTSTTTIDSKNMTNQISD